MARQTPACSVAIRRAEQASLLLPQARACRPRSTRYGRQTGAPALDSCLSIQEHLRSHLAAADPCLLGGSSACGAGPSAAATGRAPASVDTLRTPDWVAGSDFISKHLGTPAPSPGRGRPLLFRWQSGVRSRPFCCCHRPGRRPRSTRCGRQTGAPALILSQSIRERLRRRQAAADPCLLGGSSACGAGPSAAATGPGAGLGRHAADARLGRRL